MGDKQAPDVSHDIPSEIGTEPFNQPIGITSLLWAYPVISLALMLINLYFIVHALKSGRSYYWVWIIFAMPVLGAAAYFFVEMRPTMPRIGWQRLRWRFTSPQARAAHLSEIVTETPTVKNRLQLAREYEAQGQWTLAADQYRESLSGVFANDPRLRICLASALLESGESKQSHAQISQVDPQRDSKLEADRKLAMYRCQAAIGQLDPAIAGLTELAKRSSSLAAQFYLAQAMSTAGREKEAIQELEIVIKKYRAGNALLRKSEQAWYAKATQLRKVTLSAR